MDLDREGILVDVDRFRGLLAECRAHGHPEAEVCAECLPPLTEAVELYRDDFMAGFGLRDSVAFDDWQFFQSEDLRRDLAGALERLARGRASRSEWETAIRHARRRLVLDPLHEPAHRLLLALYAWSGQRAAALRQYRECVRITRQRAGRRTARRDYHALPVHPGERSTTAPGPLRAGPVRPAGDLAYGPFVEGLSAALVREGTGRLEGLPAGSLGEAARLMPELSGLLPDSRPLPPFDTPGARRRFYEGVIRALLAVLDGPPPGVLFLDDLQWADEASLDLLTYLVRRLDGKPLLVLVTWRPEEVPEDHRLRGLLAEARRSGAAKILGLGRLDPASIRELVTHALGGDAEDPGPLVSRLGGETEGLPLFLAEYLTAVAEGELGAGDEAWALPGGVQDLLKSRLRTVGETAGQVLAAAAVVGRSFDFDTVRAASGRGEEETLTALEELVSRGLIREVADVPSDGPTYDFDHDKLRTLVYEQTGLARRRLLHRRAAVTLAGRARGRKAGPLAGQVARHHRLAGQDAEAAEYHRLAWDHARGLYANGDALAHYEEALALGHPDVAALHEAMGDLRTRRGDYGAALDHYEPAAASGDPDIVAMLEHKIGNVHARRGDRDLARSHYESALAALEGPGDGASGELARLYADLSLLSHLQDEPEEAREFAQWALGLADEAGDVEDGHQQSRRRPRKEPYAPDAPVLRSRLPLPRARLCQVAQRAAGGHETAEPVHGAPWRGRG